MNRIDQTFARLKTARRKALIGYITAGFPTRASFSRLIPLLEKAGLDLLEVGVPFSDPMADGPTIQHSSQVALRNGVTLQWIFRSIRMLRQKGTRLPIIFMSYCNPIHAMGVESFFSAARASGVDGLIIPDMIPEEASVYQKLAARQGVDLIFLITPTTPDARIRMIAGKTKGFLYAVSLTGVTGARRALPSRVAAFLRRAKRSCLKPLAVGFGLSTARQVHDISRYSDGVIVGSALIREIQKSPGPAYKGAVRFVRSLAQALNPKKDTSYGS